MCTGLIGGGPSEPTRFQASRDPVRQEGGDNRRRTGRRGTILAGSSQNAQELTPTSKKTALGT